MFGSGWERETLKIQFNDKKRKKGTLASKITTGIYKLFQIVLGSIVEEEFKHVYFYFHNYVRIAFDTFASNTPSNTQSDRIWHKDWYKCLSKWMKSKKKMKKRRKIERNCLCLCCLYTFVDIVLNHQENILTKDKTINWY